MSNFASLIQGFGVALQPGNIGACLLGAILGLVVGAMPGIGSLAGCALLLPLTYKFNPTTAIIMLGALCVAVYYTYDSKKRQEREYELRAEMQQQ